MFNDPNQLRICLSLTSYVFIINLSEYALWAIKINKTWCFNYIISFTKYLQFIAFNEAPLEKEKKIDHYLFLFLNIFFRFYYSKNIDNILKI